MKKQSKTTIDGVWWAVVRGREMSWVTLFKHRLSAQANRRTLRDIHAMNAEVVKIKVKECK